MRLSCYIYFVGGIRRLLCFKIMGIISDHFAAEIEKMKARHEADALRVERRIKRAQELLDEIRRLNEGIA